MRRQIKPQKPGPHRGVGVVGPGAIAAATAAAKEAEERQDQVRDALSRDLEAARHAAERAFRQYNAADPANRLVASELEARWNRALAHAAEVEGKIAKHDAATAAPIADPASLGVLASNLKTVWDAPTTDARLKKRIVRTLVHEVVADIDEVASEIVLIVHWVGGAHSELRLPKRRRGQRNSASADIIQAVRQLVLITSDDLIAGLLNRNGLKTGNGNRWTASTSNLRAPATTPRCSSPPMTGSTMAQPWELCKAPERSRPRRSAWPPKPARSKPSIRYRTARGSSPAPR